MKTHLSIFAALIIGIASLHSADLTTILEDIDLSPTGTWDFTGGTISVNDADLPATLARDSEVSALSTVITTGDVTPSGEWEFTNTVIFAGNVTATDSASFDFSEADEFILPPLQNLAFLTTSTGYTRAAADSAFQPLDADLTDLADGSLSGAKVGSGINADNITSGTLSTDRLPDVINATLIPRKGTAAEIDATTLAVAELAVTTDTDELRVGDGSTGGGVMFGSPTIARTVAKVVSQSFFFDSVPNTTEDLVTFQFKTGRRYSVFFTFISYEEEDEGEVDFIVTFEVASGNAGTVFGQYYSDNTGSILPLQGGEISFSTGGDALEYTGEFSYIANGNGTAKIQLRLNAGGSSAEWGAAGCAIHVVEYL